MNNKWTYGQYVIIRTLLGLFIASYHLISLHEQVYSYCQNSLYMLTSAIIAMGGIIIFLGIEPQKYYSLLTLFLMCLERIIKGSGNGEVFFPYIEFLLLLHICIPSYRYEWRMPPWIYFACWAALAGSCFVEAYTRIGGIYHRLLFLQSFTRAELLGLLYFILPFSFLVSKIRPWVWLILLALRSAGYLGTGALGLFFSQSLLHFIAFDPGWIKPKQLSNSMYIFFDASCGLCHRSVIFILSENVWEVPFIFSPLYGKTFSQLIPEGKRKQSQDSIIVYEQQTGALSLRGEAVIQILSSLGGVWRILSIIVARLPKLILDRCYNRVAVNRHRFCRNRSLSYENLPSRWTNCMRE